MATHRTPLMSDAHRVPGGGEGTGILVLDSKESSESAGGKRQTRVTGVGHVRNESGGTVVTDASGEGVIGVGGKHGKRLVVLIIIKNAKELFTRVLREKLGLMFVLCCCGGVFDTSIGHSPGYCACCCIRITEYEITETIGQKISDKLAENGIMNELQVLGSSSNSFRIIVRKMNTLLTKAAKSTLEKKLKDALTSEGVEYTLSVSREKVFMHKTTEELRTHQKSVKEKKRARQTET